MQSDAPNAKKPCKSILKTSSSFDRPGSSTNSASNNFRKSAKFDELNVLQTYHPPDKDYGHMKIDEPKTPYNYAEPDPEKDQLDANMLARKLRIAAVSQFSFDGDDNNSDDEGFTETPEEKLHRIQFEKRRKKHYKEFEAVRLARKLIKEELGEDFNECPNNEDIDDEGHIDNKSSPDTEVKAHNDQSGTSPVNIDGHKNASRHSSASMGLRMEIDNASLGGK